MRFWNAWIVLAMCGFACAALAQTQNPPAGNSAEAQPTPQTSGPAGASSPHQRTVTGHEHSEATPNTHPGPLGASSPHQRTATRLAEAGAGGAVTTGMSVMDRSGQPLGTVSRVTPESARHRYVVITGTQGGNATPVPYTVASSMMAAGRIVLDREAFEQAPKIKPSQASRSSRNWQSRVDRYWSKQPR